MPCFHLFPSSTLVFISEVVDRTNGVTCSMESSSVCWYGSEDHYARRLKADIWPIGRFHLPLLRLEKSEVDKHVRSNEICLGLAVDVCGEKHLKIVRITAALLLEATPDFLDLPTSIHGNKYMRGRIESWLSATGDWRYRHWWGLKRSSEKGGNGKAVCRYPPAPSSHLGLPIWHWRAELPPSRRCE